ncbi:MAG TPA: hypothetical protein VFY87_14115 [Geminicoccaceae bacterium]|nr:hypothetical protein [Geminicoccaceae bacterium]
MSPTLRRRLGALEARQAQQERKLRRRSVWWDVLGGEPRPVAGPGEELHVHRWLLPDEEAPAATGARPASCSRSREGASARTVPRCSGRHAR